MASRSRRIQRLLCTILALASVAGLIMATLVNDSELRGVTVVLLVFALLTLFRIRPRKVTE